MSAGTKFFSIRLINNLHKDHSQICLLIKKSRMQKSALRFLKQLNLISLSQIRYKDWLGIPSHRKETRIHEAVMIFYTLIKALKILKKWRIATINITTIASHLLYQNNSQRWKSMITTLLLKEISTMTKNIILFESTRTNLQPFQEQLKVKARLLSYLVIQSPL